MDFRLIETMRVSGSGDVFLLDRHLDRLSRSSDFFSFRCDVPEIRRSIVTAALPDTSLRLTLSKDGELTLECKPLPQGHAERLILSSVRVNSSDEFLYHKTTNRAVYDAARRECDDRTDAILINERGEITETTILNIAVFRDGRWVTPRVSCGLLAGVMREELIERGEIVEDVIQAGDLRNGEMIRCFNGLRGVFEAKYRTSGQ
jgi:para-aminobenzoate synthetase / 4-amino-4-deoxychorismate lyase